jgi:hypothetical protein
MKLRLLTLYIGYQVSLAAQDRTVLLCSALDMVQPRNNDAMVT